MLLALGVALPMAVQAKHGKRQPPQKIGEATIVAVTADSITTSTDKAAGPRRGAVIGGDGQTSVTKTYKITSMTTIEVDGQTADVTALHVGMSVSIGADPDDDLGPSDASNGGTATTIIAHEGPVSAASPAAK